MLESGVVDYGPEFLEVMEKGGWDLTKVDRKKLKESKLSLVMAR
jgi:F-type H+-transporting ATPase subunit beta